MRCSLVSCQDMELQTLFYIEKYFAKKQNLQFAFAGLDKAFDRVQGYCMAEFKGN